MGDVVTYIAKKRRITIKELADYLGVSWQDARNIIRRLEYHDIIRKIGRGIWEYNSETAKLYQKLERKILDYLEGETTPVSLAHLSMIFRANKSHLRKILAKLEENGKVKRVKRGYYIHADMVEYEVGSGKVVAYKTPIEFHHIGLEYNCQKSKKITVSPYGHSGQISLDEMREVRIGIGGKNKVIEVDRIWRNRRTGWWEIDITARLLKKVVRIHMQVSDKKIYLMTKNGEKALTLSELEEFVGWLSGNLPIDPMAWRIKEIDINEDWMHLYERFDGFKEMRLDIAMNEILHIYKKKLKGTGTVIRKEIQYHDKEGKSTIKDIIEAVSGVRGIKDIRKDIDELKKELEELKKREVEGGIETPMIVELSKEVRLIEEINKERTKVLEERLGRIEKNQEIIAKGIKELLEEVRVKKERELEELKNRGENKEEPSGYI